jgi:ankyrin repeat protein
MNQKFLGELFSQRLKKTYCATAPTTGYDHTPDAGTPQKAMSQAPTMTPRKADPKPNFATLVQAVRSTIRMRHVSAYRLRKLPPDERAAYEEHQARNQELHKAAETGNVFQAGALLREGADPEAYVDDYGFIALLAAAKEGHARIVQELVNLPATNVDYQAKTGTYSVIKGGATALMLASLHGHTEVVEILLAKRAQVDTQSSNKNTALILASIRGHVAIVELLVQAGCDIEVRGDGGATAFQKACYNGHLPVVQKLSVAGADPFTRSTSGGQAKTWAQKQGHKHVVNFLENVTGCADKDLSRTSSAVSEAPTIDRCQSKK